MSKKFSLLLIGILFPLFSIAQDLPTKLSKKLCKCLKKEKVTNLKDMNHCFEKMLIKNLEDIYKYYDVETINDIDFDKLGAEIAAKLGKECNYIRPYLINPINKFEEDFVPEENLDCSELHSGDFYYLTPNSITNISDTTFVTIKNKMYLERMDSGRKYSLLEINWTTDCQFVLKFKNSNDPFKSSLSEKGEKYYYEMVSSTPTSFTIRLTYKDKDRAYKFELFKY